LSFKVKSPSIHFIFKKTHLEHKFLSVRQKMSAYRKPIREF